MLKSTNLGDTIDSDFINNFYLPYLKESKLYDLMVCYLNPETFLDIKEGLNDFFDKDGCCWRMLISPEITRGDILIDAKNKIKDFEFSEENKNFFKSEKDVTNLIAWLLKDGILQIRVVTKKDGSKFHLKQGLFQDSEGSKLFHNGSNNFTKSGMFKNDESITTIKSWIQPENDSFSKFDDKFEQIWGLAHDGEGEDDDYYVYDLMSAPADKLKDIFEEVDDERPYSLHVEAHKKFLAETNRTPSHDKTERVLTPCIPSIGHESRKYQIDAIDQLEKNSYRGLLEMATASGKTIVAIMTAIRLYDQLKKQNKKLLVIVTCQDIYMTEQWSKDLTNYGFTNYQHNSETLSVGEIDKKIDAYIDENKSGECLAIVTTKSSASSEKFLGPRILNELLEEDIKILLISDEAHHDAASEWKRSLRKDFLYRIALTATPTRLHDEEGTEHIKDYFDGAHFIYDLKEAIYGERYGNPRLCKYKYYPRLNFIDETEIQEIQKKLDIKTDYYHEQLSLSSTTLYELLQKDLEELEDYKYTIIYTAPSRTIEGLKETPRDDIKKSLDKVLKSSLGNEIRYVNIDSQTKPKDRSDAIKEFSRGDHDIIIAIKCLDQGINIPAIKRAFILHSSTNPREYIQRRGRILRQHKDKDIAYMYDYVLLPGDAYNVDAMSNERKRKFAKLVEKEKLKVEEYRDCAENKDDENIINILNILKELESLLA
tara:strand:- start:4721 stop:6853 length:2133 start_codon:yes stop_codon:yes gene_type:complete